MATTTQPYNKGKKRSIKGFIKTPLLFNYYFTIAKMAFMVLVPVVLLILPSDFFDSGQSLCLSRLLLDMECFACGMTRAIMHLIHLDFETAYSYNFLSFIVFPLLCILWSQWFIKELKRYKQLKLELQSRNAITNSEA